MTLKSFTVLLAVGLLAFAAVACNGGGNGGETPQAGETPTEGETPQVGDEDDDDGNDSTGLQDLAALASEASGEVIAKVTYRFTSEAGGEVVEGEWVLVQRPPDSRFEFVSTVGGEEFRTIIISAEGESYLCSSGGGEGTCLTADIGDTEAQTAPLAPLFDVPGDLAAATTGVDLIDRSERSIAGLDATCFTVSSGISGLGEGEVCFSEDGLLLFLRSGTNGDGVTFEATSASTDVTDDDFEPPFEVIDLGDLGG
jgi:hypothetical protein